jgi:ketosteroid isomerase-like protein
MRPRPTTSTAIVWRSARRSPCADFGPSLLILFLTVVGLVALSACGGSGTTTAGSSSPMPVDGDPASPTAAPSVAATPVALVGTDSVAVTRRVVDLARAALHAPTAAKLARPYADEVVGDDHAYGAHFEGKSAVRKMFRKNLAEYSGARWVAGYAGRGWAVIEERWDFTKTYGGTIQLLIVQEARNGKVVREDDYYQTFDNLPEGQPLEPRPLTSAPGPADTPAAAEAVALNYAAALQAKDAAAVAALSAPSVDFTDTASSTVGRSPEEVQAAYSRIFGSPADLAFTQLRYAFGRGWATVMWTASAESSGAGGGATMLEIRGGKISRETLYYTSTNVPFRP